MALTVISLSFPRRIVTGHSRETIMRYLFLLCFTFLAACATSPTVKLYDGKEKPVSQLLTIRVPMELEIMTINDRRIEGASTMFAYGDRELQLLPGDYKLVLYYKDVFQLTDDQHEVVKSDPSVFNVSGKAGDTIEIRFNKPANVEDARKLAKDFEGTAVNLTSGDTVASKPSGLIMTQGFLGLASSATQVETPAASTIAPMAQTAPASSASATPGSTALETLKNTWKQATPEERQKFLLWMSQ